LFETNTFDIDFGFTGHRTSLGSNGVNSIFGTSDLRSIERPHVIKPFVVPTAEDDDLIFEEHHLA